MRIANLVPGTGLSTYAGVHVPAAAIAPGVTVETVESGFHLAPDNRASFMLDGVVTVAAAVAAERAGFDAAFVNGADYGLAEIRATVAMPVVGAMEESMRVAAATVDRFSIVQVWPASEGWVHEHLVREYGFEDRCASIRHVTASGEAELVHEAMYVGEPGLKAAMTKRIIAEIIRAVHEDGAQAIVLGCTCMCSVVDEIAAASPVPVINGIEAAFSAAQAIAKGDAPPRTPAGSLVDDAGRKRLFEDFFELAQASRLSVGNEIEACPVCAPVFDEDGARVG